MKSVIQNVILYVTISVISKSASSLERQKRIVTVSDPSSSHIRRSPFQPPDENGNTVNFQENHLESSNQNPSVPKRSPFLPPGNDQGNAQIVVKVAPTTKPKLPVRRAQNTNTDSQKPHQMSIQNAYPSSFQNNNQVKISQRNPLRPATTLDNVNRSPFQPRVVKDFGQQESIENSRSSGQNLAKKSPRRGPLYRQAVKGNVRKPSTELELIMERQRENTNSIPSISDIQVNSRQIPQQRQQHDASKVKTMRSRPRHTSYQNKGQAQRDMHDAAPGVTPWTRYTARPRNVARNRRVNNSSTYRGRCGNQQYSPRSQICCQGKVLRRQGIRPSCCGSNTYDAIFKKCCQGEIIKLTDQRPNC